MARQEKQAYLYETCKNLGYQGPANNRVQMIRWLEKEGYEITTTTLQPGLH